MSAPYSAGCVTYKWRCHQEGCGVVAEESMLFNYGDSIWQPSLPEGWNVLTMSGWEKRFYCPKHTLVQLVDGKVIE